MILEGQVAAAIFNPLDSVWVIARFFILLLAVLYFIFSLIVVRQVNLMTETLITEVSPLLRAISIIHAGFALGVVVLFIGFLFG